MCNGIPVFTITDFGEHGNSESIPALQTSFIDMASMYYTINCKPHQYTSGFMLIKLISEARKADWLQA